MCGGPGAPTWAAFPSPSPQACRPHLRTRRNPRRQPPRLSLPSARCVLLLLHVRLSCHLPGAPVPDGGLASVPAATSHPGGRPGHAFTLLSPFTPLAVALGAQGVRVPGRPSFSAQASPLQRRPCRGQRQRSGVAGRRSRGTLGSTRPGEPLRRGHIHLPVPLRARPPCATPRPAPGQAPGSPGLAKPLPLST